MTRGEGWAGLGGDDHSRERGAMGGGDKSFRGQGEMRGRVIQETRAVGDGWGTGTRVVGRGWIWEEVLTSPVPPGQGGRWEVPSTEYLTPKSQYPIPNTQHPRPNS